jgi:hypothetical protein
MLMQKIILWTVSVLLTLGAAYYQRKTGPTYPLEGKIEFIGTVIDYSLGRSNRGLGNQEVSIIVPNPKVTGRVLYKRYKSNDAWTDLAMLRQGDRLFTFLPQQPPAGKLEYYVELRHMSSSQLLPEEGTVITRHTGKVPDLILYPHILCMFFAMLFSFRAGLETFFADARVRTLTLWAFCTLFIGGFILGMLVQHYAFGPYWTGIPFGWDMTDNKTLIAFLGWLVAVMMTWNKGKLMHHPGRKWYVLAATIITLLAYMIPHSVMGSELDYSDEGKQPVSHILHVSGR